MDDCEVGAARVWQPSRVEAQYPILDFIRSSPSPKWRASVDRLELQCEQGAGPFKGHGKHASCGIADGRPWSVGDNINLAVG